MACPLVDQKGSGQDADKAQETGQGELFGEDKDARYTDEHKAQALPEGKGNAYGQACGGLCEAQVGEGYAKPHDAKAYGFGMGKGPAMGEGHDGGCGNFQHYGCHKPQPVGRSGFLQGHFLFPCAKDAQKPPDLRAGVYKKARPWGKNSPVVQGNVLEMRAPVALAQAQRAGRAGGGKDVPYGGKHDG